jgi:predicted site-specific integrase-resolvase
MSSAPPALQATDLDRYLNRREVAALLRISEKTLCRWIKTGRVPEINLSRGIKRYRLRDIDAFMQSRVTT